MDEEKRNLIVYAFSTSAIRFLAQFREYTILQANVKQNQRMHRADIQIEAVKGGIVAFHPFVPYRRNITSL